jgi:hypothetical protein
MLGRCLTNHPVIVRMVGVDAIYCSDRAFYSSAGTAIRVSIDQERRFDAPELAVEVVANQQL